MIMAPVGLLAIVLLADRRADGGARSTRGATRPSRSWCSRWCCGCARTSTRRPTSATIMIPTDHPGRGDGVLLHPAGDDHAVGPARRTAFRRPRACRTSCASRRARSAPRSPPRVWENRAALHHAQLVGVGQPAAAAPPAARSPDCGASGFSAEQVLGADQPPGRPAGLHAGRERHVLRARRCCSCC